MPGAVKSRRGYDSPRRREQAAETRRKILDAAGELFARDGYAAVAMPAIADRAGVALKTVYLAFGTKAGVLHGLWDVRLGGDDQPIPVTERPWYRELLEGDDPVALVRAAARQSRLTKERAGDLMRIISQAAATEPVLADLWERIETEFRAVLGGFAERLAALGPGTWRRSSVLDGRAMDAQPPGHVVPAGPGLRLERGRLRAVGRGHAGRAAARPGRPAAHAVAGQGRTVRAGHWRRQRSVLAW